MLPDYIQVAIRNYRAGSKVQSARPFLKKNLHTLLLRSRRELVNHTGDGFTVTVSNTKITVAIGDELFDIKT